MSILLVCAALVAIFVGAYLSIDESPSSSADRLKGVQATTAHGDSRALVFFRFILQPELHNRFCEELLK